MVKNRFSESLFASDYSTKRVLDLVSSLCKCSNSMNKHISYHRTKIFLLFHCSETWIAMFRCRPGRMDVPTTIFNFHKTFYVCPAPNCELTTRIFQDIPWVTFCRGFSMISRGVRTLGTVPVDMEQHLPSALQKCLCIGSSV